jgi:hypothetical protein
VRGPLAPLHARVGPGVCGRAPPATGTGTPAPLAAPAAGGHPGGQGRPAAARSSLGSSCSRVWR